eukprot:2619962-Pleurochrysis_carterae.AAC.1
MRARATPRSQRVMSASILEACRGRAQTQPADARKSNVTTPKTQSHSWLVNMKHIRTGDTGA